MERSSTTTIIVGLGNPGEEYAQTRHNAGFMLVELFAQQQELEFSQKLVSDCQIAKKSGLLLVKPQLFMNRSGEAVSSLLRFYKLDTPGYTKNLVVAYDDLDIPLGSWKLQWGTAPKKHNGTTSIVDHVGTQDFWHLRIGTDARSVENRVAGQTYVLQPFLTAEKQIVENVLQEAIRAVETQVRAH